MADNPLLQIHECGQSVWNDFISRSFIKDGDLRALVENDGLTGVTSNPTIFQKSISGSSDYDDDMREAVRKGLDTEKTFQYLASNDVRMACDVLRPVYDRTNGQDGYVSIEVSPDAAHDEARTLEDAHTLWSLVDRPNVMIKVPATPEGLPAVEELISEGINVNITLIFAIEVYEKVMEAYIRGLERRNENGRSVDRIASVASFFVSRVDTLVDKQLDQRRQNASPDQQRQIDQLYGQAAVANAKIAYELFEKTFGTERFHRLAERGAMVQRPLWASTSTKNPSYSDTLYVDSLVGPNSVNTMPPQTIDATRDHGRIQCDAVKTDLARAHECIKRLNSVGVNMTQVTSQLTAEGVQSFQDSLHQLFDTIRDETHRLSTEMQGTGPAPVPAT